MPALPTERSPLLFRIDLDVGINFASLRILRENTLNREADECASKGAEARITISRESASSDSATLRAFAASREAGLYQMTRPALRPYQEIRRPRMPCQPL
jgi:hypothetical protein